MMSSISTYSSYDLTSLSTAIANVSTIMTDYVQASINDIASDTSSLSWFNAIANRSRPTSCGTDPTFLVDSLVPNTNSNSTTYVACASGTTIDNTCTTLTGCTTGACINMYNIMSHAANLAGLTSEFSSRYATGTCGADLATDFTDNYNNWYLKRIDTSTGIAAVQSRWTSGAYANINTVVTTTMPAL
jgi:hypothetical protein